MNLEFRPQRIGVIDLRGNPIPPAAAGTVWLDQDEVARYVEHGKTPWEIEPIFNTAALGGNTLYDILDSGLSVSSSTTKVFRGAVRKITSFRMNHVTIIVTGNVYSDFDAPMRALMSYLSGFQVRPLSSAVHSGDPIAFTPQIVHSGRRGTCLLG